MAENAVTKMEQNQDVAAVEQSATVLQVIERAAQNPNIDVDKMDRLLQMHERIMAKQAETAFNGAMNAAQREMRHVSADASNPQTKSKYASYAALDRASSAIYTKTGFSVSFDTGPADESSITVLAYVSHEAGHTRTYRAIMPADGKGAKGGDVMTKTHAHGAAMSYGMRYLLKLIFNVAVGDDDNDGNPAWYPISPEQKEDLIDLMKQANADTKRFLGYFKIEALDELPASRFKEAKDMLLRKKQDQGASHE